MRFACLLAVVVGSMCVTAWGQLPAPAGNDLPGEQPSVRSMKIEPAEPLASEGGEAVMSREVHDQFARELDVGPLRTLAVYHNARVKILDTMARETLTTIYGKPRFKDLESGVSYDPVFTLLDLTFNSTYYLEKPVIYVENLEVRQAAVSHLPADEQELWLKRGRLSPRTLWSEPVIRALEAMVGDITAARALGQVQEAGNGFVDATLGRPLAVIAPAPGSQKWLTVSELPREADQATAGQVMGRFVQLSWAWHDGDAAKANQLITELAEILPTVNAASYPPAWLRYAERFYNFTGKFTYSYIAYFVAFVGLMCGLATGRAWLLSAGAAMLAVGMLGHTLGLAIRMALAADWRIHNQYESFIMLSWFAVVVALVLMMIRRQWLFGAAASAVGAAALLIANTTPIPSQELAPVAGILETSRILYIHVNTVVFSYALITLGFVVSLFYLGVHYFGGSTSLQLATAGLDESGEVSDIPQRGRAAVLNDLDKAQMVVLQLAFWLLGVGILLGAWWADHSWGRWWGWDPKETWALITWIVYLIVIHLRLAVQRRGLVTAWMSVVGFFTMLWTHWGVNLVLAGLHSYA